MYRQPAVAGNFYPADPVILRDQINQLLSSAKSSATDTPKAIIAPHAGYIYSGPIAASVYTRLQTARTQIARVVLLGPSHRVAFNGLALSTTDGFDTPLGHVPIDKASVALLAHLPFIDYFEQAHSQEHSLEVQLPFLQVVLNHFQIIPVVVGNASPEQVCLVLDALWGGDETLIVISSDLSHYHDYARAQQLDKITSTAIERLNYHALTYESACGRIPISGLLKWAAQQSLTVKTIDLRNSGDTAGDKKSVVGYGAYVIN
ncbi:MAG: AmmeMemoRadiSam system protein B [Methylovulum sp.]|nr:AmmeMemoRadiSam system protein B [Methylovulum sp.]MCF7999600.1 AmmeMemoRadiSam system protein B [Methylovulum sp.]